MILVTGGTGFLGSHLLAAMYLSGLKARVIRRKNSGRENLQATYNYYHDKGELSAGFEDFINYFEWFEADLLDYTSLTGCLENIDEVFHLAARVSFQPGESPLVKETNLVATANLVNLAIDAGVKKFHYASSIAALQRNEAGIINEVSLEPSAGKTSAYGSSKYQAEMEVWRGYEEGLSGVIINPGVMIGPGYPGTGSLKIFLTVKNGLKFYPVGSNGYVDVRDTVDCLLKLSSSDTFYKARYLLVSGSLSYKAFFDLAAGSFGTRAPQYQAPLWLAHVLARMDGLKSLLTGAERVITPDIVRLSGRSYRFDNSKIKAALGYEFRTCGASVKETAEFIRKYYSHL